LRNPQGRTYNLRILDDQLMCVASIKRDIYIYIERERERERQRERERVVRTSLPRILQVNDI
jgi:hypothetical protein